MKRFKFFVTTVAILFNFQNLYANNSNLQDTVKMYNIDEIVISSTKETNTFRTLPGPVSIISPQAISSHQIDALKDLSFFVPNLYIPDYGSKLTSAIYIRGIGTRSSGQSIGLYVDNVSYLDKSTFDFELTDIQRIEVLRGPQGTLYGRNAMGGIVNIYTLSPFNFQGTKLVVSGGNYEQFKAKASRYVKVGEKVGLSLSGYYDRNAGYFTNIHTGKKTDYQESIGGHFKFGWHIIPQLLLNYIFSYDYVNQGAFPYGLYDKETDVIAPVNIGDSCSYKRNVITNNLSLEYKTNRLLFSSTTGYQYFKDDMLMDQDFSPKDIFTINQLQKQHAFSEELAVKSITNNNYQWSFGLYGFYNDLHIDGPVTFKEDGIKEVLQPVFNKIKENNPNMPFYLRIMDQQLYIPGSFDTPSYGVALFHQSTYNNLLTKGLSLTAGIRLDYEKQEMDYTSTAMMRLGMSADNIGTSVIEIPGIEPTVMDEHTSQGFWEVLPKISLKYECTPRTFTYVSVAKGYKTGGYNVQMSADLMQAQMRYDMMKKFMPDRAEAMKPNSIEEVTAYTPEKSWSYELGVRSEIIKERIFSEFTLFYMDIKDMQITKFVESGNGRYLSNAGKARSLGCEVSLGAKITNELTADLNYGFTQATFIDYIHEAQSDDKIIETDCDGNRIPYTPQHTLSIGMQYNKLLRNSWLDQLTASVQFTGSGEIYWTELNDTSQKFYGLLNAKVAMRKGIVKLGIWSRNITNTQYAAFYFESFGRPYIQKGKPFQIGAEISIAF